MCALTAGQRGAKVLLLEHLDKAGAKILISGGGRCNFTNLDVSAEHFLSDNPHFCRSSLSRYTQHDFIAMVADHGIAYHEKTLGQLFCDGSAREIVAMLVGGCEAAGVDMRLSHSVGEVSHSEGFRVATNSGDFYAHRLVLASGGLSIPKMGATGLSHDLAMRFGLSIVPPRPGLVPFTATPEMIGIIEPMMGVSLRAIASIGKRRFEENILFTHRGLSGPAVLQISSYWKQGEPVAFDLVPSVDVSELLVERKRSGAKSEPATVLGEFLPSRLAREMARVLLPFPSLANIPDRDLVAAGQRLNQWVVTPSGTEGWAKAEVTVGGIDTNALSSKTMEARDVPGLYAIGEAVDVTGWLGGYNFQWAWSSGWRGRKSETRFDGHCLGLRHMLRRGLLLTSLVFRDPARQRPV